FRHSFPTRRSSDLNLQIQAIDCPQNPRLEKCLRTSLSILPLKTIDRKLFESQLNLAIPILHLCVHNFGAFDNVHIELVDLSTASPLKSNILLESLVFTK